MSWIGDFGHTLYAGPSGKNFLTEAQGDLQLGGIKA
jgi:hypothetical protein